MDFKDSSFWIWWREYGKHVEAVLIISLLILVFFVYHNNNKLQTLINENCGWGEETYRCVCGKEIVEQLELKINYTKNSSKLLEDLYVELDK